MISEYMTGYLLARFLDITQPPARVRKSGAHHLVHLRRLVLWARYEFFPALDGGLKGILNAARRATTNPVSPDMSGGPVPQRGRVTGRGHATI